MFDDEEQFNPYRPDEPDELTYEEFSEMLRQMVQDGKLRTYYDAEKRELIMFKLGVTKANPQDVRRN
jgi:hypothetical protein